MKYTKKQIKTALSPDPISKARTAVPKGMRPPTALGLNKLIKEEILKELYPQFKRQMDRVKLQHQFGPKDVEEMAKQLSLEAGEKDQTTYNWQNFIDHAKEKLAKDDLTSGDSF